MKYAPGWIVPFREVLRRDYRSIMQRLEDYEITGPDGRYHAVAFFWSEAPARALPAAPGPYSDADEAYLIVYIERGAVPHGGEKEAKAVAWRAFNDFVKKGNQGAQGGRQSAVFP